MSRKSETPTGDGVSKQAAFDILSARRRRYVLYYLFRAGDPVDLRTLSEQVAAWENDVPKDAVGYDQRMRVYTALRQAHLPKMDRADVVAFDPDRGVIRTTTATDDLKLYLELAPHREVPWAWFYLGISAIGALLIGAAWVDVAPLRLLSGLEASLLTVALFAVAAVVHVIHTQQTTQTLEVPAKQAHED